MELLLLVLIIPMIPFYIMSTFLSAGIFMLGIPFIIFAAIGAFLRGFIRAILSRNVFPTLLLWKERFGEMRRTGKWYKDYDDEDQGTNHINSRLLNHVPESHLYSSPVLSNDQTVGSHHDHVSNFGLNLLDQIPVFVAINEYFFGHEAKPTISPRLQLLHELADNLSTTASSSDMESLLNQFITRSDISRPVYSDYSLYTAPTHQSLYEMAQEVNSVKTKSFFEEFAFAAQDHLEDISPEDSASQVGSDRVHYDDRADTTDAAKLLSMFSYSSMKPIVNSS